MTEVKSASKRPCKGSPADVAQRSLDAVGKDLWHGAEGPFGPPLAEEEIKVVADFEKALESL